MTRRVARLVQDGLVGRACDAADARGIVVLLTEAGLSRLTETAPVHVRGVSDLFVAQLTDQELAFLESALTKVTPTAHSAEGAAARLLSSSSTVGDRGDSSYSVFVSWTCTDQVRFPQPPARPGMPTKNRRRAEPPAPPSLARRRR